MFTKQGNYPKSNPPTPLKKKVSDTEKFSGLRVPFLSPAFQGVYLPSGTSAKVPDPDTNVVKQPPLFAPDSSPAQTEKFSLACSMY